LTRTLPGPRPFGARWKNRASKFAPGEFVFARAKKRDEKKARPADGANTPLASSALGPALSRRDIPVARDRRRHSLSAPLRALTQRLAVRGRAIGGYNNGPHLDPKLAVVFLNWMLKKSVRDFFSHGTSL